MPIVRSPFVNFQSHMQMEGTRWATGPPGAAIKQPMACAGHRQAVMLAHFPSTSQMEGTRWAIGPPGAAIKQPTGQDAAKHLQEHLSVQRLQLKQRFTVPPRCLPRLRQRREGGWAHNCTVLLFLLSAIFETETSGWTCPGSHLLLPDAIEAERRGGHYP